MRDIQLVSDSIAGPRRATSSHRPRAAVMLIALSVAACGGNPSDTSSTGAGDEGSAGAAGSSGAGQTGGQGSTGGGSAQGGTGAQGGDAQGGTGARGGGGQGGGGGAGGSPGACADANAGIGWAGNWGELRSHACTYSAGIADPFVVDKTGVGHDCQIVTAEVWIPGVTDAGADPSLIRAEVVHAIGAPDVDGLSFLGQEGNNYRYMWNPGIWHPYAPLGSSPFHFRFSFGDANDGCWYRIDLGDGPAGSADRTLAFEP